MKNLPIKLGFITVILLFSACTSTRYGHRTLRVKATKKEVVKANPAPSTKVKVEHAVTAIEGMEKLPQAKKEATNQPVSSSVIVDDTKDHTIPVLKNTAKHLWQPQDSILKKEADSNQIDKKPEKPRALRWARITSLLMVISLLIAVGLPAFLFVSLGLAIASLVLYRNTEKFAKRFGFWLAIIVLALLLLVAVIVGFYLLLILAILGA
jgi:hypothetical protein